MTRIRATLLRFLAMFLTNRHERALADEIASHLQLHIDDNLRAGMTPDEARRHALIKLGGIEATKQAYRERRTLPTLDHLRQDVRFAVRQLVRNPGVTATALLMLTLGIGTSLAIFGFVDAALIAPLPYRDPARLVHVTERTAQIPRAALSYLDYLDWKRLNTTLGSLDVFGRRGYTLTTSTGAQIVPGIRVSDGFFRTLGISPVLGRDFHPGEDLPGAPSVVILSHAAWQNRFGGRADVIGQPLTLNNTVHTIVGALPEDFHFGGEEVWTTLQPTSGCDVRRSCHNLEGIARLKDDVSIDRARAEMITIASQLERQYPDSNRGQGAVVTPLAEVIVGNVRPVLLVLLAGAGLLLVIACVNVASLLLVRSESRRRELAVRSALGASRARLIGQFVAEAVVLVTLGVALGLVAAHAGMDLLSSLISTDMKSTMPYLHRLGLNAHVFGAAGVVALIAMVLFAATPACRLSTADVRERMAEGSRGSAGMTWQRLGFKLVILELATAMVLLAGAGLLGKSFSRLLQVDLAFDPDRLATLRVVAPRTTYTTDEQRVALARRLVSRIGSLPGVTSVGHASVLPVSFNGNTDWIRFVGRPYNGEHNEANQRDVSADYFATIRATLVSGRYFTETDDATKPRVAIVNRTLARLYFPGEDPIGARIGDTALTPDSIKEIVGVVDDIREGSLESEIWPAVYYPFSQSPDSELGLIARTAQADEPSLLRAMRAAVREIDPAIATIGEATMRTRINESPVAYLRRSSARLIAGFAGVALLLGVVGLYGVVAYSVSQRTREIGVRIALGAPRGSVYGLVLREAGVLVAIGIAIGLAGAVGAASLMRTLLFGTPPWDAPTLATVAAVLATAALCASYIPARRAASINPIEALRIE